MHLNYVEGTPLWYWYYDGGAIAGFGIAVLLAALVVGLSNWRAGGITLKTVLCGAAAATIPLGMASLGLKMAISDPELVGYLSAGGTAVAVVFGFSYLIGRLFGKGNSPQPAHALEGTSAGAAQTPDVTRNLDFHIGTDVKETMSSSSDTISLGRDTGNDIVIDHPSVSRNHARIHRENGRYFVEDLSSMNGTQVNGKPVKRAPLDVGSVVKLGKVEVGIGDPGTGYKASSSIEADKSDYQGEATYVGKPPMSHMGWLTVNGGPNAGKVFYLKQGDHTFGRNTHNDFVIDDPFVSGRHGLIRVNGQGVTIFDLGSRGGLKVNETALTGRPISPGGIIAVGDTRLQVLRVDSPEQFASVIDPGKTMVDLSDKKTIALVAVSGPDAGTSYPLTEGDNVIGRTSACQVRLTDKTVSRSHALIKCEGDKLTINDLGSSTRTEVDGQGISGLPVSNGDVVTVGKTELTFGAAKS